MNDSPLTPANQPQGVAQPTPTAPKPTRKKWLIAVIIVGSIIVFIPLVMYIIATISTYSMNVSDTKDAKALVAKPLQADAFLDARYAAGAHPLTIESSTRPDLLGMTKDRSKVVVFSSRLGEQNESVHVGELSTIDVDSSKKVLTKSYDKCSNVTPQDTVYCTKFENLSRSAKQVLEQVNLANGNIVSTLTISGTPLSELAFLGRIGDTTLLQITLDTEYGTPTYDGVIALKNDTQTLWAAQIPEAATPECALYSKAGTVVCQISNGYDIEVIDAKTGEQIAQTSSNRAPIMTSDGWLAEDKAPLLSTGITIDEPTPAGEGLDGARPGDAVFTYDAFGKKERKGGTIISIVPQPKFTAKALVTYPSDGMIIKNVATTYIVDATGKAVMHKKATFSASDKYVFTATGTKAFEGVPEAVTSDGQVVLVLNRDILSNETRIVNVKTGKDILAFDRLAQGQGLDVSHGIITDNTTGKMKMYLPGK